MPQRTHHPLIHVLLLWLTVLSVVQIVFVVLFFTDGHHGLSQNSSAVALQANASASSSNRGLPLNKMFTFKFSEVKGNAIYWEGDDPDVVSKDQEGKVLKIKKDGCFLLNLHVTLTSCNATLRHTVKLTVDNRQLQGVIHSDTCSTAIGKVMILSVGTTLQVTIEGANVAPTIDGDIFRTYLDIIYMQS